MSTPLKITDEDTALVDDLFYHQQQTVAEILKTTGFNKYKVARILNRIQLDKQLKNINKDPAEPIEPGEFERVYKSTYKNSNFVLLTHNEEILKLREKLT